MVIVTINGKKKDREFQNMSQALAFAYQNGECNAAEKLEIAYVAKESVKEPEKPAPIKNTVTNNSVSQPEKTGKEAELADKITA